MILTRKYSFQAARKLTKIKFVIIHYTGMQSESESLNRLRDPLAKVSCHYLISRNGKVFRLVKDRKIAWHAGKSCWGKYINLNKDSIGIELVNRGHEFGYANFTKKQILTLKKLCSKLVKKYKIKRRNIIGHSDIAPLRKKDPGEKFPWAYLAKSNIGIWHDFNESFLSSLRSIKGKTKKDYVKFYKNLRRIGYCFSLKNKRNLSKTTKSFQRHYRKSLINGLIDQECIAIASNLAKKL